MTAKLDLRPPDIEIIFKKGMTLEPIFLYLNSNGTVTNLTGYTARMMAKLSIDDTTPLTGFDLTTENGGLSIVTVASYTAPAGTVLSDGTVLETATTYTNPYGVQMNVSATVTTAIDWDSAVFDIELITPTSVVLPFIEGILTPSWEVTK
jgi:hypothetical protein